MVFGFATSGAFVASFGELRRRSRSRRVENLALILEEIQESVLGGEFGILFGSLISFLR